MVPKPRPDGGTPPEELFRNLHHGVRTVDSIHWLPRPHGEALTAHRPPDWLGVRKRSIGSGPDTESTYIEAWRDRGFTLVRTYMEESRPPDGFEILDSPPDSYALVNMTDARALREWVDGVEDWTLLGDVDE